MCAGVVGLLRGAKRRANANGAMRCSVEMAGTPGPVDASRCQGEWNGRNEKVAGEARWAGAVPPARRAVGGGGSAAKACAGCLPRNVYE